MVTAGTYNKKNYLDKPERLSMVKDILFKLADSYDWRLQAWAIMSNHYHFVALSPQDPTSLKDLIRKLHSLSAREINQKDNASGRKVWFQYWDTHISYQNSYLARLNYVHHNPVHHGIKQVANQYQWCSAKWFELNGGSSFVKTVKSIKTDRINVIDDF